MRVWTDPFTPDQEASMTGVLFAYRASLLDNFMSIFDEIEEKMKQ